MVLKIVTKLTMSRVFLFSPNSGFEQVQTQYMLQMGADVMFSRCEDDDVINEMKRNY